MLCEGEDAAACPVEAQIDPKKDGNVWNDVKALLKTNADGVATFDGRPLVAVGASSPCKAPLTDATIS